jgi:hypothetical protein
MLTKKVSGRREWERLELSRKRRAIYIFKISTSLNALEIGTWPINKNDKDLLNFVFCGSRYLSLRDNIKVKHIKIEFFVTFNG